MSTDTLNEAGLEAAIADFQKRTGGFGDDDDRIEVAAIIRSYLAATQAAPVAVMGRLYDDNAPMADGEIKMTAAEDVLTWLLIEKIGVPDDRSYTPKEAQDILRRAIDRYHEYEIAALSPTLAVPGDVGEAKP